MNWLLFGMLRKEGKCPSCGKEYNGLKEQNKQLRDTKINKQERANRLTVGRQGQERHRLPRVTIKCQTNV